MSKIDRFLAKPMEVTIGGENYMIKPFTVKEISILTRMSSKDDEVKAKAMEEAIFKVMQQIDSEVTKEQVEEISMEYLEDIINVIAKVNGTEIDPAKAKLLEDLRK